MIATIVMMTIFIVTMMTWNSDSCYIHNPALFIHGLNYSTIFREFPSILDFINTVDSRFLEFAGGGGT